jgi:methylglutaconyl-CoA hydratase
MPERIDLETLFLHIDGPVATCTLNRPDIRNAFNAQMIKDITWAAREVGRIEKVRVMVLTGAGTAFSAGAEALADCMNAIYTCRRPTIARVNGPAIGGGNGLVAACDIAIASEEAIFSLSEVKLGLVPATIAPYVVKRIGEANARYLMLTGHRFTGIEAAEYGLVNWAVPRDQLNDDVDLVIERLLTSGPEAMHMVKELIRTAPCLTEKEARTYTAKMIADLRNSDEGQEGIAAFLEKRKPTWAIEK